MKNSELKPGNFYWVFSTCRKSRCVYKAIDNYQLIKIGHVILTKDNTDVDLTARWKNTYNISDIVINPEPLYNEDKVELL